MENTTNTPLFEAGIERTISRLEALGENIVLVTPIPEIGHDVPSAVFVAAINDRDVEKIISPSAAEYKSRANATVAIFDKIIKTHKLEIVDLTRKLCNKENCPVLHQGIPLYRDNTHLSTYGSKYTAELSSPLFTLYNTLSD